MNQQQVKRPRLIRADSQLRIKWLAALSILIIMPAFFLWVLPATQEYLVRLFSENDSRTVFSLLILFYSLFSILAIMLITTGLHFIQAARKVHISGRFPAPDMRVVRDTWLVSGVRATFISYLFIGTGILLLISGGSVPYYFHNLLLKMLMPVG